MSTVRAAAMTMRRRSQGEEGQGGESGQGGKPPAKKAEAEAKEDCAEAQGRAEESRRPRRPRRQEGCGKEEIIVIPAQAGSPLVLQGKEERIPAFAGVTRWGICR